MLEIMKQRHSVRQYENKTIEEEKKQIITSLIQDINFKTELNIQACFDEPKAFDTFMAHYGKFEGVTNYIALVGQKGRDEEIGYYGEKLVLKIQSLGLNSCWVAMTYGKGKTKISKNRNEKLYCVLAIGYGKTQGVSHKIKSIDEVSNASNNTPDWFKIGVEAALLAPTAMNQQKFKFIYKNDEVFIKTKIGFYSKIDLGIAKYHFEIATGRQVTKQA